MGNTPRQEIRQARPPVHPHASGEHLSPRQRRREIIGSSPREWGTLSLMSLRITNPRFIPTRVGNTGLRFSKSRRDSVHPHASGEHARRSSPRICRCGSSPREWGTRTVRVPPAGAARFIPTRVGNTIQGGENTPILSVHPHASGEHCASYIASATPAGSSPREWGTPAAACSVARNCRFIPTRVGNTLNYLLVCTFFPGSSPREWGTRLLHPR